MQSSTRWSRVQSLFEEALEKDPPKRITFLKEACEDDLDLYQEVVSLLESDQQINSLVDGQALDLVTVSESVLEEPEMPAAPIGPYHATKRLGQGGMGVVYLAERADGQFDQQVALKLIKKGMDSENIVRRFIGERQILARLQHQNIARLLDGGITDDGQPYFAMEYVEGVPIHAYCNAQKLDIQARLRLFDEVCKAVHYAHRNLVVHRDLKPGNILITRDGGVKLLDFGIARVLTEEADSAQTLLTQPGQRVLTPEYAAPEQVTGDPITTQTDIYALGVVLYELLTGVRPLKITSHSPVEVEIVLRQKEPARPSVSAANNSSIEETHGLSADKLRRKLLGDLDTICLKALRKEPDRRYESADEFRLDIVRYLKGQPVSARPDAFGYRFQKFVTRHRSGVLVGTLVLLLLGTVVLGYTLRLQNARNLAQVEATKAEQAVAFLSSLFEASNPHVTQGDTLNARHMLDAGAERIRSELADQPDVQADLMLVIGDAYNGLGLYKKAEDNFIEALHLIEETQGTATKEAIDLHFRLADIKHTLNEFQAADSLQHVTLDLQKQLYGEEHPEIAATLLKMASTQRSLGNYEEAIPLYIQAVDMNERVLPKNDPELSWSINNLGWAYHSQGRYQEAEEAYSKAEAIQREHLGETHPDLAFTLNNYGGLLWTTGRFDEGEPKVRESLSIRKGLYGEEHPEYLQSLNNLAGLLFRKGDIEAAEPLYRQTVVVNKKMLGERHRYVASGIGSLATIHREKGELEEAEKLQLEALDIQLELFGDQHRLVARSKSNLAAIYRLTGSFDEAKRLYSEALDFYQSQATPPIEVAFPMIGLGLTLTQTGDPSAAQPLLDEALMLRSDRFEASDLLVAEAQAALGYCLCTQGNCSEGRPMLRKAINTFNEAGKSTDRRALEIKDWLETY